MARDLVFGVTLRDWSLGRSLDYKPGVLAEVEDLDAKVARLITEPPPVRKGRSVTKMVKDAVRRGSEPVMDFYEKYHPTYKDHTVRVKVKV